jgi:hypothetical protein
VQERVVLVSTEESDLPVSSAMEVLLRVLPNWDLSW